MQYQPIMHDRHPFHRSKNVETYLDTFLNKQNVIQKYNY